jgi:hypothetical protein
MRNMKKLLAALMAVMVLVLAAPAVFAEDVQPAAPAAQAEAPKAEAPKAEAPRPRKPQG